MNYVQVKLTEIGEGYVQYQSVGAFLTIGKTEFLLDSELIDAENPERDVEIINDFCAKWEILCNENNMKIEFDEDVDQLIIELNVEIE